jgi:hypothetical protein
MFTWLYNALTAEVALSGLEPHTWSTPSSLAGSE